MSTSLGRQAALKVSIPALLGVGAFVVLNMPAREGLARARAEAIAMRAESASVANASTANPTTALAVRERMEGVRRQNSLAQDAARVYALVSEAGSGAGVEVTQVQQQEAPATPAGPQEGPKDKAVLYRIEAKGSYAAITAFVEGVESKFARGYVSKLGFDSPASSTGIIAATVELRMLVMDDSAGASAGGQHAP